MKLNNPLTLHTKISEGSHIDHVLASKLNNRGKTALIINDEDNLSDHLLLEIRTNLRIDEVDHKNLKKKNNVNEFKFKWKVPYFKVKFKEYISRDMSKIIKLNDQLSKCRTVREAKLIINAQHKEIHRVMLTAAVTTAHLFKEKAKERAEKDKKWWNDDLMILRDHKNEAYKRWDLIRDEETLTDKKDTATTFRKK